MDHDIDDSQRGTAQYLAAALGNLRRISTQFDQMADSMSPLLIAVARELRTEIDRAVAAVIITMATSAPESQPAKVIPRPSPGVPAETSPIRAPAKR